MEEAEKEGKGGGRDSEVVQQEQKRSALQDQHGNKKHCLSITILIQATAVWMSVCMCVIIDFFVGVRVMSLVCMTFFLSLYPCICAYAFVNQRVPAFAFVCACTYWQGFKETFSLHLSLICPAEYRELFTLQNQGSLGGFAAFKVSLGSGHTCVQKKNIGLQGEIGLALHSMFYLAAHFNVSRTHAI